MVQWLAILLGETPAGVITNSRPAGASLTTRVTGADRRSRIGIPSRSKRMTNDRHSHAEPLSDLRLRRLRRHAHDRGGRIFPSTGGALICTSLQLEDLRVELGKDIALTFRGSEVVGRKVLELLVPLAKGGSPLARPLPRIDLASGRRSSGSQ